MGFRIRSLGRLVNALNGFVYDFKRYALYSAWAANMRDPGVRGYHMVKVYHSLEKSLSFKSQKKGSGWGVAKDVRDLVDFANSSGDISFFDRAGLSVLQEFINSPGNLSEGRSEEIRVGLDRVYKCDEGRHGSMHFYKSDFERGKLQSPEDFFLSRYSLREFLQKPVDLSDVKRVVSLALKTPSVCNRQGWHVYYTSEPGVIADALSHQKGNRGFGHKVPNLIIITTDLKAFMPGQEHYQHWIDGGLFSMSLIYALHSIGIASCCLNWSQSPAADKRLRKGFNIKNNHTIMMMLAFGYPDEENSVCASSRRPIEEVMTELKSAKDVVR